MADTQHSRTTGKAQTDTTFADNTNGDITAADWRQSDRNIYESAFILTSQNIASESNVWGQVDETQVIGNTSIPLYDNTNEVAPRLDIYSADEYAIRIQNNDNVDADEEFFLLGQNDSGEFGIYRGIDTSGTHSISRVLKADENSGELYYRTGTWTPVIESATAGTGRVTEVRSANYIEMGDWCHAQCYVKLTTLGSGGSGFAEIQGLPFTSIDDSGLYFSSVSIGFFNGLNTSVVFLTGTVQPNSTIIRLRGLTAAAASASSFNFSSLFTTDSELILSTTYKKV